MIQKAKIERECDIFYLSKQKQRSFTHQNKTDGQISLWSLLIYYNSMYYKTDFLVCLFDLITLHFNNTQ